MPACRIGAEARRKITAAWTDLIGAVASGGNIGAACAAAGVSRGAVYAFMRENPDARSEWELAREESADAYADQISELLVNPMPDAQVARVRMDALRWLAAKRNPRAYSDKAQLDVNVRTVDLTRIIEAANARLAGRAPRLIERDAQPLAHAADAAIADSARKLLELM